VVTETVVVPVPFAVSVTGDAVQVPAKFALALPTPEAVAAQLKFTVPVKPLTEVTVSWLVLPLLAPPSRLSVAGVGFVTVKEAAVSVTAIVCDVAVFDPLVPVTVTLNAPLVPGVVVMVSTEGPAPAEATVTLLGNSEQCAPEAACVSACDPDAAVTAQLSATEPANGATEVTVRLSVSDAPETTALVTP
jgi:hypothetical protein